MQTEFFPLEVTTDAPRITLTGNVRLMVEQHKGLRDCQEDGVSLQTASGLLRVAGQGLTLLRYTKDEAVIAGRIESIELRQEGRRG